MDLGTQVAHSEISLRLVDFRTLLQHTIFKVMDLLKRKSRLLNAHLQKSTRIMETRISELARLCLRSTPVDNKLPSPAELLQQRPF